MVATAIKLFAEGWLIGIGLSESSYSGTVDVVDVWRIGEVIVLLRHRVWYRPITDANDMASYSSD